MRIDVHNHPEYHGHGLEKFLANMAENNIDITWLLSWECPAHEVDPETRWAFCGDSFSSPAPFDRCVSFKERAPDKFVLGYAPDPRVPGALNHLKSMKAVHDVRVCGEIKLRMMLDNWDAIAMYRYCGEQGMPVLVHIDYEFDTGRTFPHPNWWYGGGIDAFERAIAACPETNFIGHAPGFWAHISDDNGYCTEHYPKGKVIEDGKIVQLLRKYDNLYCDISAGSGANALKRDPEFTRRFLTEFSDRILYGRDYFDNVHQQVLDSLGLEQEVLDKIYFKNALRLVPLE